MSARQIYQEIWRRLSPRQRRWFVIVAAVAVANSMLETAVVVVTAIFLSALITPPDKDIPGIQYVVAVTQWVGYAPTSKWGLTQAAGWVSLVGILARVGFTVLKTYLDARYAGWCFRSLSTQAFEQVLRRPYMWHVQRNSATTIKAVHQDMWNAHHLIVAAVNICSDLMVMLTLLLALTWKAGPACIGAFAVLGSFGFVLHRLMHARMRYQAQKEHEADTEALTIASQALHGIKDTQVLGRQRVLLEIFEERRKRMESLRGSSEVLRATPRLTMEVLAFVGLIGVAELTHASGATPAQMASTLAVLGVAFLRLMPAVNRMLNYMALIATLLPGASQALHLFPLETEPPQPPREAGRIDTLELRDLCFTYPGESEPSLNAVSVSLARSRRLGLVGKSGGGKTTLADVLCGLLPPDSGEIRINGAVLQGGLLDRYPGRIGYVLQDPFLLDATIAENVAFRFEGVEEEKVWECLRMAQVDEFVRGLEEGLATRVGERGVRLSGGQAQRLAIARSLYTGPDLLILDEATSALDSLTEASFLETLDGLSSHLGLVLIAHRLSTVRSCDCIIVLEHGRVLDRGSHQELLERCEHYRALVAGAPNA